LSVNGIDSPVNGYILGEPKLDGCLSFLRDYWCKNFEVYLPLLSSLAP